MTRAGSDPATTRATGATATTGGAPYVIAPPSTNPPGRTPVTTDEPTVATPIGSRVGLAVAADPELRDRLVGLLQTVGADPVLGVAAVAEAPVPPKGRRAVVAIVEATQLAGAALLRERGWCLIVVSTDPTPGEVHRTVAAQAAGYVALGPNDPARPAGDDAEPNSVSGLSGREIEIAGLVARGHGNKQIAAQLGLSPFTVKSHLSRMAARLGTTDRAHLTATTMRAGLIH